MSTEQFDYVVVSTGMYSLPNVPKFPDQDKFKGEIMHAEGFTDGA